MTNKITIYVSDPIKEKLQSLATKQDRSVSYVARQIIESHLAGTTPQPQPQQSYNPFKPGDKIRIIKVPSSKRSSKLLHQTGTIINRLNGKYVVQLDSGSSCELSSEHMKLIH